MGRWGRYALCVLHIYVIFAAQIRKMAESMATILLETCAAARYLDIAKT